MLLTFSILIWKKYEDNVIRLVSLIPSVVVISLNCFENIINKLFPKLSCLKENVSRYGMINSINCRDIDVFIRFMVVTMIIIFMVVEIFLLADNIEEFIVPTVLIIAGMLSRISIGFSPTIWASGYRTCGVMCATCISGYLFVLIRNFCHSTFFVIR